MQGKPLEPQQKQKFLQRLRSAAGNVSKAAKAAAISRNAAYDHKNSDPDFSQAWDNVIDDVVDAMEQEMHRRATRGVLEPVFYQGEMVAKVRKHSDRLLEFALKAKRPDVYRERFDVNTNVSGTLDVNIEAAIKEIYGIDDDPAESIPGDAESTEAG